MKSDKLALAIANAAKPQAAPNFRMVVGLENGREAAVVVPEDATDSELLFVTGAITNTLRPAIEQKRTAGRPRILVPQ